MSLDYRNKLYKSYQSTFVSTVSNVDNTIIESLFDHYNKKLLPFLISIGKDAKILELGCGPGYLLDYLKMQGFYNCTGIDISEEQIEISSRKGHSVKHFDVFDFFKNSTEKFDIIFAFDFIEHFSKDEILVLSEFISNSLNQNGLFIIRTPNGQGFFPGQIIYGDLTHQTILNPNSMNQLLLPFGFREIIFIENAPFPKNIKGLVRAFLWKLLKYFLNFLKLIESGSRIDIWSQDFYCVAKK